MQTNPQNIKICSFKVGNVNIYKASTGEIHSDVFPGKYKIFNKNQEEQGEHIEDLRFPYLIGEDREGAELMEFNGMDFVRTVKRVVKKSPMEMFKELLEMLEGCLVKWDMGTRTSYVGYKNELVPIGCHESFNVLRPYMRVLFDNPRLQYGIIEKQSLFIFSKEIEKLHEENEEKFLKVYNQLKGM